MASKWRCGLTLLAGSLAILSTGCSLLFPWLEPDASFVERESGTLDVTPTSGATLGLTDGASLVVPAGTFSDSGRVLFVSADLTGKIARFIAEDPDLDVLSPFYLARIASLNSRLGNLEIHIPVSPAVLARYGAIFVLEIWSNGAAFLRVPSEVDVSNGLVKLATTGVSITSKAIDEFRNAIHTGPDFGPFEVPLDCGFAIVGLENLAQPPLRSHEVVKGLPDCRTIVSRDYVWNQCSSDWINVMYQWPGLQEQVRELISIVWDCLDRYEDLGITRRKDILGQESLYIWVMETEEPRFDPSLNQIFLPPWALDRADIVAHELLHWIHFNNADPIGRLWGLGFGDTAFVEAVAEWASERILMPDVDTPLSGAGEHLQWSPFIIDDIPCPQKECEWFGLGPCEVTECQRAKYSQAFLLFSYSRRHGPQAIVDAINRGDPRPYGEFWTEEEWAAALEWLLSAPRQGGYFEVVLEDLPDEAGPDRKTAGAVQYYLPSWTNKKQHFLSTRPGDTLDLGPLTGFLSRFVIGAHSRASLQLKIARAASLDQRVRVVVVAKAWDASLHLIWERRYELRTSSESVEFTFHPGERGHFHVLLWRGGSDVLGNRDRREFVDIHKKIEVQVSWDALPPSRVTGAVSPNPVTIGPGGYHPVTYTFREGSGCKVDLPERTGQFLTPLGEALTAESGRMAQSITVPAGGETAWVDNIYLPPGIDAEARRRGLDRVVLRARFYGQDCGGRSISVTVDLTIVLQTQQDCPDLAMQRIWTEPESFAPGQRITLWLEAKNIGTSNAGSFRISLLLDGREIDAASVNGLAVGKVLRGYKDDFIWPVDSGCHTIAAVLDSTNAVSECREDNNILAKQLCPSVPPQLPDLVVKSITLRMKSPPPPWTTFDVVVVVENVGGAPAQGPFEVALTQMECPVTGDSWSLGSQTIPRLGAGETYQWTWCCIGMPDPPMADWCAILIGTVDPDNVVRESNEANNSLDKRFGFGESSGLPSKPTSSALRMLLDVER